MTNGSHFLRPGKEGRIAAAVMVRQTVTVADPMVLLLAKDMDLEGVARRIRGRITPVLGIMVRMDTAQTDITDRTVMVQMGMDHSISGLIRLALVTKDRIIMVPDLVDMGHKGAVLIMEVDLADLEQGMLVLVPEVHIDKGVRGAGVRSLLVGRVDFLVVPPMVDLTWGGQWVDPQVEQDNSMNESSRSSKSWT